MSNFRFWGTIITALVLGLLGYFLGESLFPFFDQMKYFLSLTGVLIGFLTFSQVASWVVTTSTRLTAQVVAKIASEVINQFTHLTSRGWSLLPSMPAKTIDSNSGFQSGHRGLQGSIILDTSSIIDGRVLDVTKSGFLLGIMIIPNFVLTELQQVADSGDSLKRARGRRGFEIVDLLKKVEGVKIEVWDKDLAGKTVDDKLIRLGKILHGRILTCDFNLNRVASLNGVRVLNLNELSNALKALPIPGERLEIKIVHPGKDKNQGVGYISDGTMVVVKDASSLMGQEVKVEVSKIIQGPAGRMIFGTISAK